MTVLIAGGGTGGHVFPMLSVGAALERTEKARVFYVGTARGLESRLIPQEGGDLELLEVAPLRGGGLGGFARGVAVAARSIPSAIALVRRRKPDVVLSVGGYAGGPVALAARALGVPVALLEPNGVLGLSNKLLAPFTARAYGGFGDIGKHFKKDVVRHLGVPLRGSFVAAPYRATRDRFHVLVLGGSQGAQRLNEDMPAAFARLRSAAPHARILHQTGRGRAAEVEAAYAAITSLEGVTVTEFVSGVAAELEKADVVVQRSGASSLAELCVVGRPSVLVPYPFAADQHQLANARYLERLGASVVIDQAALSPQALAATLIALEGDVERRAAMAAAAASEGKPDAAGRIADDLLELAATRSRAWRTS